MWICTVRVNHCMVNFEFSNCMTTFNQFSPFPFSAACKLSCHKKCEVKVNNGNVFYIFIDVFNLLLTFLCACQKGKYYFLRANPTSKVVNKEISKYYNYMLGSSQASLQNLNSMCLILYYSFMSCETTQVIFYSVI